MAVKKPAMVVKTVHRTMQTISAKITRATTGSPVKSNTMDRSVPASRISPATPKAKNMRGEACCRMFKILLTVSSGTFLPNWAIRHSIIKMITIAMYRPLRSKKSRRLNVYL